MKQNGLTLIELMIALAILALLLVGATPGWSGLMDRHQRADAAERLLSALRAARTDAVTRNTVVILRAIDGDWSRGWRILLEDGQDGTLLSEHARNGKPRIFGNSKVKNEVRFAGLGVPMRAANGSFYFCLEGQPVSERKVVLSMVGRTRIEVATEQRKQCG